MAGTLHSCCGPLVLLGGEALRPESLSLWQQLKMMIPQGTAPIAILLTALAEHKPGMAERRADVIQGALNNFGLSSWHAVILTRQQADDPALAALLEQAAGIYLAGGEPSSLHKILAGSAAWETICLLHQQRETMLIAAGGAAVALGELSFVPLKPFPRSIDDLRFEISEGLRLLPKMAILPYFSWLPSQVLEQLTALYPPDLELVGIDDQAALVAHSGRWTVYGTGNVTLLHAGRPSCTVTSGQPIPSELLSPYPAR